MQPPELTDHAALLGVRPEGVRPEPRRVIRELRPRSNPYHVRPQPSLALCSCRRYHCAPGYLDTGLSDRVTSCSMIRSHRLLSIPLRLVPMLVLLLVLGHTCDLPAYVDLVSHADEDARPSAHDHADENLISCDGVAVPSNTGYLQLGPGLDVAQALPVASRAPARLVISSLEDPKRLPSRPLLFLLYASLLI